MMKKTYVIDVKTDKNIRLLNPSERGKKFAYELKTNKRYTNDNEVKANKDGSIPPLTATQKSYRSGYLKARSDNAKCYNYNKKKNK